MKKIFCIFIVLSLISCSGTAYSNMSIPDQAYGTYSWANWDPELVNRKNSPNIRGVPIILKWETIEPENGKYQFDTLLGDILKKAKKNNYYTFIMLWIAPFTAEWIYQNGVPPVKTDRKVNALGHETTKNIFPYYLSPTYKKYFFRLIKAFGEYVDKLPDELYERIIFVQSCEGSTGDGWGYKGKPLDKKYDMTRLEFDKYRMETWNEYKKHFQDNARRPLPILVNLDSKGEFHEKQLQWILKTQDIIGEKQGMFSHGYHVSENTERLAKWTAFKKRVSAKGKTTITRGEMDAELNVMGWSKQNIPQALYWSAIFSTHLELDVWNVPYNVCPLKVAQPAIIFFNKYAGKKNPATAKHAFIAFRKGLDASDTDQFPELKFGEAKKSNISRYIKIISQYKKYGAIQGDPKAATAGGMKNRKRKDYNDAGWGILPGNYSRFITQINSDKTSVGWFHAGPKKHLYSRFARGFEHSSGKKTILLKLHNDFLADKKPHDLLVRVVYLDKGKGKWSLIIHDGKSSKTAYTVQCKNSKKWQEKTVNIKKGYFDQKLENGADLILKYISEDDTIFHIVEVTKK